MTRPPTIRTISLTDRPPVRIHEADWPILAEGVAESKTPTGDLAERVSIYVRTHQDGRALAYGVRRGHAAEWLRAGFLLPSAATVEVFEAVQRIAFILRAGEDAPCVSRAVSACLSQLPPEVL